MNPFADTTPEARLGYEESLRRMTRDERIRMAQELTLSAQRIAFAEMRERYPELSDDDIRLKLAVVRLGEDVVRKVYGRVP
jgi:hypothetical protein